MLTTVQITNQQIEIEKVLRLDGREGMNDMLRYLHDNGFYMSPASTKFHGCYEGGLARHSLSVRSNLIQLCTAASLPLPEGQSAVEIPALLHDVCKIGAYRPTMKIDSKQKFSWNREQPKGHGLLSIIRILEHIDLSDMEEAMIKYHMCIYNSIECMGDKGEFVMRPDGMFKAWNRWPLVKFIYFADEIATAQERAEEGINK